MSDYTTNRMIESLYVAWFNRWAESSGMNYWLTQYNGGATAISISNGFWSAATAGPTYPWGFTPTMSATAFVEQAYLNITGRSIANGLLTTAEVAYWANEMGSPTYLTQGAVMVALINGFVATDMLDPAWQASPYNYTTAQCNTIQQSQIAFENKIQVGLIAYANSLNPANPTTYCVFGGSGSSTSNVTNVTSTIDTCLSGIGVTVGATIKFLILGQSNAANFATTNGLTYNTSSSNYTPAVSVTTVAATDAWYAAQGYVTSWDKDAGQERIYSDLLSPGAANNRLFVTDSFGTANPLGGSCWGLFGDLIAGDRHIMFDVRAVGSASVSNWTASLDAQIAAAYANNTFNYVIWQQGEIDCLNGMSQATYASDLATVLAAIRAQSSTVPIFVTNTSNVWNGSSWQTSTAITGAQTTEQSYDANTYAGINTDTVVTNSTGRSSSNQDHCNRTGTAAEAAAWNSLRSW